MMYAVGEKLKKVRECLTLEQKPVARKVKMDAGYLSRLESGNIAITKLTPTISKLCHFYDIDPKDMLDETLLFEDLQKKYAHLAIPTDIHQRLMWTRIQRKLTLRTVSKQINLSTSALSKIEHNQQTISLNFLQKISECYQVSIAFLVGETNYQKGLMDEEILSAGKDAFKIPSSLFKQMSYLNQKELKELEAYALFLVQKRTNLPTV